MINLHHLTTHSTTVLTYKMAIVLRPQICDVISPYLYTYTVWRLQNYQNAQLPQKIPLDVELRVYLFECVLFVVYMEQIA